MADPTMKTRSGSETTVPTADIKQLSGALHGPVLMPQSSGYDEARAVWNAMVDRRPGIIAQCATPPDVVEALNFARSHDLLLSVRGAGHNIAGNAVCDGGMTISFSKMSGVRVDPKKRRAWVEPGATLGQLDAATQKFGLATPVGINSTTGIAGLTLGGGFGWLSRKFGLTIDNLRSAEVVTASGKRVRASTDENADLFWGLRGGGGNFGIVTSFELELHPVGPQILSGLIVHPLAAGRDLLRFYRDFVAKAPDELAVWGVLRKAPPLPFLPADVHGTDVIVLAAFYAGDMAAGEKALAPLRAFGKPIADVIGPHPYTGFQAAFDPLLTEGARNYWKSHYMAELTDEALDILLRSAAAVPDPQTEIFIAQMGGATSKVPEDATAYRHRAAKFIVNVHGRWNDPAKDARCIGWCRELFDALAPHAMGGAYVNFMTEEEQARVTESYGDNYARLAKLKGKYDPQNVFHLNQNIRPQAANN
jgi:FAD/FMN-containing dehydrogenase